MIRIANLFEERTRKTRVAELVERRCEKTAQVELESAYKAPRAAEASFEP